MADDNATKSGARHSTSDIQRGRSVKAKAREIVRDMEELGFPDPQDVGHPADAAKGGDLPDVPEAPVIFGAVKAAGDWELDVLYLPYGGPAAGKDSHGEYFSAKTNEHADKFPTPVILYYHGYAPDGKPQGDPEIIGQPLKHLGLIGWALHAFEHRWRGMLERDVEIGRHQPLGHQRDDLADVRIGVDIVQTDPNAELRQC